MVVGLLGLLWPLAQPLPPHPHSKVVDGATLLLNREARGAGVEGATKLLPLSRCVRAPLCTPPTLPLTLPHTHTYVCQCGPLPPMCLSTPPSVPLCVPSHTHTCPLLPVRVVVSSLCLSLSVCVRAWVSPVARESCVLAAPTFADPKQEKCDTMCCDDGCRRVFLRVRVWPGGTKCYSHGTAALLVDPLSTQALLGCSHHATVTGCLHTLTTALT